MAWGGFPGFAWLRHSNPGLDSWRLSASQRANRRSNVVLSLRERNETRGTLSDEQAPIHFPCLAHTRLCRRGAKRQRPPRLPSILSSSLRSRLLRSSAAKPWTGAGCERLMCKRKRFAHLAERDGYFAGAWFGGWDGFRARISSPSSSRPGVPDR